MPSKVWDEITYPFPNFKDATVCDEYIFNMCSGGQKCCLNLVESGSFDAIIGVPFSTMG